MADIYSPVGFCTTLGGSKKAATIMAIVGGLIGGTAAFFLTREGELSFKRLATTTAIGTVVGAVPLALGTYFQCRGVEVGVPVKK